MGLLVSIVVVALIATTALIRAYAELDEAFLQRWARAHSLRVTPANRPMVGWYLRNARVLRTWGALAGFFLPLLVAAALDLPGAARLEWVFVGYLLAALYAELSLVRPLPPGKRAAALVPRTLTDYLPRELRNTQRVLGAIVALGCFALILVPYGVHSPWSARPELWVLLLGFGGSLAFATGLEWVQGWLVRRPQPFTDAALIAADDAIRSQSLHSVSGSGIAVLLLGVSAVAFRLAESDVQILRWGVLFPGLFALAASLFACQYYGHRSWKVRRSAPAPAEKTAPA